MDERTDDRTDGRWTGVGAPRRVALLVALGGILLTVTVVGLSAMSRGDAVTLVAIATGTAALGAGAGAVVLWSLRRRALAWQVAGLACTGTLAVMAGAWVGAQAMFFSSHDLAALEVLLLAGGTVGCTAALLLGSRVGEASARLIDATRSLGSGEVMVPIEGSASSRELDRLAAELQSTSARLDEARRRERALEHSRRELIAWVSHDLRTPLAGIRAIAEALEDGVVSDAETVARYHTTLRRDAEDLAGLIDDLFELSRTQDAVLALEMERISLGDLVSDALAGIAPVADAKGVRLEGCLVGSAPELLGSPPELLRALRNLLENAVRHTPADGSVRVEAGSRDDAAAYVSVVDTGGGIPEGDLSRVFDVGYRGDPARTPGGGAGLGLAIARGLVEAHDGAISVVNEDRGARFTVVLPLSSEGDGVPAGSAEGIDRPPADGAATGGAAGEGAAGEEAMA